MHKRVLIVVPIAVMLLGGYGLYYYSDSRMPLGNETNDTDEPGAYNEARDVVAHRERIPLDATIDLFILGQTRDVLDGRSSQRDGWLASQITFTTTTPRSQLFEQYQELFASMGWQIDNSTDDTTASSFSIRRYVESATVIIETRDNQSLVRINLMQRVAVRPPPRPLPL